ncbi:hypothetical protein Leryth_023152 [Lithospermum erythrorhizon]|nr:hypothetical protein Leryth_023152 [Lithospermum erythrorhizon]
MEAILVECVEKSLGLMMYRNAIFMCQRLCAQFPSEINSQLLATCFLQSNQAYSAYHILKGTQMAQSRYLFALSCFHMDLLNEAEAALCPRNDPASEVPNGAAGHYLLGLVYRYTDRLKSAIHHFNQALSLDPLLWVAYEELCILGAAEEASTVFGDTALLCAQRQHLQHKLASQSLQTVGEECNVVSSRNFISEDVSPGHSKYVHGNNVRDISGHTHGVSVSGGPGIHLFNGGHSNIIYSTPSPAATQWSSIAPPPVGKNIQKNGLNLSVVSADSSPRSTVNSTMQAPRKKLVDEGKLRKISGRLFSDSGPRRSTRLAGDTVGNANSNSSMTSGNGTSHPSKYLVGSKLSSMALRSVTLRKGSYSNENLDEGIRNDVCDEARLNVSTSLPSPNARCFEQEAPTTSGSDAQISSSKLIAGAEEILTLLKNLGEGYRLSCLYRCKEALDLYIKLPLKHYNTAWVLSQVGKAHFELVDYLEAERAFSLARLASPYCLEGMDTYSTVLYHLKEDMKLSYLAQELISTDRLAPQSWCAMGNCYSLQKDHETALKNFQRAVQLSPKFAYAHTLCGHEYVALEDFESSIRSYQNALRADPRHYNAWYGLGMVYLRQEKFDFSEHHFRTAFQINPRSSVIMSYLGTTLHALKKNKEALEMMEMAIVADKKNPIPLYQKANILVSMENLEGALEVLEELKEYAPRESSVYALMGRIYKRQNMYDKAMLHFGLALDMKPSATDVATIKVTQI